MLTKEELSGIVDAMGALTLVEIQSVVKELYFSRKEESPSDESVEQLCNESTAEHILETISSEEVTDVAHNDDLYYIAGSNAFPDIPFELSEVIDALELSKREVDFSRVTTYFCMSMKKRVGHFEEKIDLLHDMKVDASELSKLENKYSTLLNLYYDFDFWLPDGMSAVDVDLQSVSKKLEQLRLAQDI
jgi:hypothetical protein